MTPLEQLLRRRIEERGPLRFSEFMETALYHPDHGYYTRWRRTGASDPFGKAGDFFTAAQLQPVFGRLIATLARRRGMKRIIDWGAGRAEMADAIDEIAYEPVDIAQQTPDSREHAMVLANELFDALPVDAARRFEGVWREELVAWTGNKFEWTAGEPLQGEWLRFAQDVEVNFAGECASPRLELPVRMRPVLESISRAIASGCLLVIDYGWHPRELCRFPEGTLMGYRRHHARDDVLMHPGERDITAHVPLEWLRKCAEQTGWRLERQESLASLLMHIGEADQFACVFRSSPEADQQRLRLQLKTLLFSMGESFRVQLYVREERP